jgi:hypothetical protein
MKAVLWILSLNIILFSATIAYSQKSKKSPKCGEMCFTTEVIKAEKISESCTRYEWRVSFDGTCSHALSHFTAEIPSTHKLSELSNSEKWKQEIGKDPTSGLTGFKIDDIPEFGKTSLKSFTIKFKLCLNNGCNPPPDCWKPRIAYKAATCVDIDTLNIPCGTSLKATIQKKDVSCFQGADGSLDVIVQQGKSPFTYLWSTGATTKSISGLKAGLYSVVVKDAAGETVSLQETTLEPTKLNLSGTATSTCNGAATGTINITASGGKSPYSFAWSNGATTEDLTTLTAGTYSVAVKDSKGCIANATFTVNESKIIITANQITPSCQANGSIDIAIVGGIAPYSYLWSNGATTEDITALAGGSYSVTVKDAKGCSANATYIVPASAIIITVNQITPSCQANGSININIAGGTAPYSYLWSNGATTEDITALAGGSYSVTVKDATGCSASATYTVPTSSITISANQITPSCNQANGGININIAGGTAPYSYLWSNGATTEDITSLNGGTYSVVVKDATGCSATAAFIVVASKMVITSQIIPSCDQATGSINVSITGGIAPYSYLWSNGATTEDITSLSAGTYTVTVKDATGCSATETFAVTASKVVITANQISPSCGLPNGSIDISATGGTAPYTYLWSNGATTEDLQNLSGGVYSVTVKDKNGCATQASYTLTLANTLSLFASSVQTNCSENASATIDLTVNGGAAPYNYLWNTGASIQDISVSASGTYSVTVTDSKGCKETLSVSVSLKNIQVSSLVAQPLCAGNTGSITIQTPTGGEAPYTYLWSNGAASASISNLTAGNYSVTVSDNSGCSKLLSFQITAPSVIQALATVSGGECGSGGLFKIDLTVSGGKAPYTFAWSTGATSEDIESLQIGNYTVKITDSNGCFITKSIAVEGSGPSLTCNISQSADPICGSFGMVFTTVTNADSYLWTLVSTGNDWEIIDGATTHELFYVAGAKNSAATFTLTITKGGCTQTCTLTVASCIDEDGDPERMMAPALLTTENIISYPNPFEDQLNFQWTASQDDYVQLEILDEFSNYLTTVYTGRVEKGTTYTWSLKVSTEAKLLYYRFITSQKTEAGKLLKN